MNKNRLEFLVDGVFAIVFTLLIIEIHLPEFEPHHITNQELWYALVELTPLFVSYFASFTMLAMFWMSHHALLSLIKNTIDRKFILINFAYLCTIAFVPFSSSVIGTHPDNELSYILYGTNIFLTGIFNLALLKYAHYSDEIDTSSVTPRLYKQALFRFTITPLLSLFGIGVSFISFPVALVFFAFPILFNIIPGGLDFLEEKFNLDFGAKEKPKA